jgi:hypothetical protein
MGTCMNHHHQTSHRGSLTAVLKGIVGLSFLAAVSYGAIAPVVGHEPTTLDQTAVTVIGAILGAALAYRG